MARKQTRRSISVSRATYERFKAYCEEQDVAMSQQVEQLINERLEDHVLHRKPRATGGG